MGFTVRVGSLTSYFGHNVRYYFEVEQIKESGLTTSTMQISLVDRTGFETIEYFNSMGIMLSKPDLFKQRRPELHNRNELQDEVL